MIIRTIMSELAYLQALENIIKNGTLKPNRTGVRAYSLTGLSLRFSLYDEQRARAILPALTTKQVYVKTALRELLWFISGSTNSAELEEKGVKIWQGNSTREFLDSRGLVDYPEGELGPIYGYQWRNWNAPFEIDTDEDSHESGDDEDSHESGGEDFSGSSEAEEPIDQLEGVIDGLNQDPFSRRHLVSAWNPEQLDEMALPPCHYAYQFVARPGDNNTSRLDCVVSMRSGDMFLGVPFNIVSYAFLTHAVAHLVNMIPGELVINIADAHIYENHVDQCKLQISRKPGKYPYLLIEPGSDDLKSIDDFTEDHFKIKGYKHQGPIKAKMAV